jgi:hypothetical protein
MPRVKQIKHMKNPNRETVSQLEDLPNIGKVIARELRLIGIDHPQQLIGKSPVELYETLCDKTSKRYDPCVLDVFMAVVGFMEGEEPRPWWLFTQKRKVILKNHYQLKQRD